MIVEVGALTTIGVGTQRVQTEPGDTVLKIPNIVLPAIELMEPTTCFPDINAEQTTSFVVSRFFSQNNAAATAVTVIKLAKGLWRLTMEYSIKCTYAAAIPFNTKDNNIRIISPTGGANMDLMTIMPRQSGEFYRQTTIRILLRQQADINMNIGTAGAADFLDTTLNICGEKLL